MRRFLHALACACLLFICQSAAAQTYVPGQVIRPATNAGRAILDPDLNDFVSATTSGYSSTIDTGTAVNEIYYRPVKAYGGEPHSDLRRGADHKFTDFVPDASNNGVYLNWSTGGSDATTYLRIRMRMGSTIPGAKGFSLLIDTDNKYGATGANADPNYVAKTTGINGNPGYELEVVLETGFRVAIYNIDGKGQPSEGIQNNPGVTHTNWTDYSQISLAATSDGGDPDYYLDWYVTLQDLKAVLAANSQTVSSGTAFITSATQNLRIIPTTVMAPKPSTAGPISDIYGSSDSTTITWQPPTCISCPRDTLCTAAPAITSATLASGTTTIRGTWTKGTNSTATTATITIYKQGSATAIATALTVTATSGDVNGWTATTTALASGDKIAARAQGTGKESNYCFTSDSVKVTACATRPNPLTITNVTNKGIEGRGYTYSANDRIKVYHVTASGLTFVGVDATPTDSASIANNDNTHYSYTATPAGTGRWQFSQSATGNGPSANLNPGSYMVIDSNTVTGCTSGSTFYCASFSSNGTPKTAIGTATQQPTITSPATGITTATSTISGAFKATGTVPATVRVYLDSTLLGMATVTAGTSWSYTFPSTTVLTAGKRVRVRATATETTVSNITTYYCATDTVATIAAIQCTNATPVIDVDSTTSKLLPGFKITGTGTAGGTVKIYSNTNTLKETVTVATDGTWTSVNNVSDTLTSYYVTLTTGTCTNAATSLSKQVSTSNTPDTYCNGFVYTSANSPISGPNGTTITTLYSDETSLHGTLATGGGLATSGTFVKLYVDGEVVGYSSVNTANNTWGPIDVSSMLFQGAIVTVGIVQSGTFGEFVCSSFKVTCACALNHMPAKPVVSPSSTTTVSSGGTPTIVIRNPIAGNFYSVRDSSTLNSMSKGYNYTGGNASVIGRIQADSTLSITTTSISQNTTAQVVAVKVGGTETCTDTTYQALRISGVLPVKLEYFKGTRNGDLQSLVWKSTEELNFNRYDIERSTDGSNYVTIASIEGKGSNSLYAYNDKGNAPVYFYRLRMVDSDGRFKYSNVVVLRDNGAGVVIESVRPNPFRNSMHISLFLSGAQEVKMVLVDISGRSVFSSNEKRGGGNNIFSIRDLDRLPAGMYVLKIQANGSSYEEKMVKSGN
jgi:hypothetical protein